jgi:dipeptidase
MVEGGLSDPSIIITTSEDAVATIKGSDDPIAAFQNHLDLGQVKFEGENYIASAKVAALLSSGGVLQFFYNVFFG